MHKPEPIDILSWTLANHYSNLLMELRQQQKTSDENLTEVTLILSTLSRGDMMMDHERRTSYINLLKEIDENHVKYMKEYMFISGMEWSKGAVQVIEAFGDFRGADNLTRLMSEAKNNIFNLVMVNKSIRKLLVDIITFYLPPLVIDLENNVIQGIKEYDLPNKK